MRAPVGSAAGFSVAELLVTVALGSVLLAGALPAVGRGRAPLATRAAGRVIASSFREAASMARAHQRTVAWEVGVAPLRIRLIGDGDGDGVRRDDVDRGVDRIISGWRPVGDGPVEAVVGCHCRDLDDAADLEPGDRGVRFGASSFISFSARGTASSGTLYLTARDGPTVAVRVLGTTGRVRMLEYVERGAEWTEH